MPKLNVTIDQIETTTNKVIGSIPSPSWTDAQYASAKTLYETYATLLSQITSLREQVAQLASSINEVSE